MKSAMRLILATAFLAIWGGAVLPAAFQGAWYLPAAPSSYTGPGDVVSSAAAWYGLRAYNAAYATGSNKSINVRRASDNSTQDILILSNGNLDIASALTFATTDATCTGTIASTTLTCVSASSTPHAGSTVTGTGVTQPTYLVSCGTFTAGAGTCTLNVASTVSVGETVTMTYGLYAATVYDQSGANNCSSAPCNMTQATAAKQPQLLFSCIGSLPCLSFVAASSQVLNAGSSPLSGSQVITVSGLVQRTGNNTSYACVLGSASNCTGFNASANKALAFQGNTNATATASDGAFHAIQYIFNTTTSYVNVDGVAGSTGDAGSATFGASFNLGNGNGHLLQGYVSEIGLWSGNFNSTQNTNMCHNQYVYWGTATSC